MYMSKGQMNDYTAAHTCSKPMPGHAGCVGTQVQTCSVQRGDSLTVARSLTAICYCRYGLTVLIVEVIGVSSMLPYGLMLVCYTAATTSRQVRPHRCQHTALLTSIVGHGASSSHYMTGGARMIIAQVSITQHGTEWLYVCTCCCVG
jgi:hypothetical protein